MFEGSSVVCPPLGHERTGHFPHIEQKPHNKNRPQQLLQVEQTPVFAAGSQPVRVGLQEGDDQQGREMIHLENEEEEGEQQGMGVRVVYVVRH